MGHRYRRYRRDTCRHCGGPVFVIAWAARRRRTCYTCAEAIRAAKRAKLAAIPQPQEQQP